MDFLVTGLPRCGSAWWAFALSACGGRAHRLWELPELEASNSLGQPGVGFSDGGALLYQELLLKHDPKVLHVLRPQKEVVASLARLGLSGININSVIEAETKLGQWGAEHPNHYRLFRYGFDQPVAVYREAIEWLGFAPPSNLKSLLKLRVTADQEIEAVKELLK